MIKLIMLKNLMSWFDERVRFEHFAVLSLIIAVFPVLLGFDFDLSDGWLSEWAAVYVFLGGVLILSDIFHYQSQLCRVLSWALFGSGCVVFAFTSVHWYVPALFALGSFFKVRYLLNGQS